MTSRLPINSQVEAASTKVTHPGAAWVRHRGVSSHRLALLAVSKT